MIEFLCPNGHRIRCPAAQAGRAARCSRCGVRFRIPEAAELNAPEAIGSDSKISRPELTDSAIASKPPPSTIGRLQKEPQIEFLCPNGHRLFGQANLQGRAGECPECGSRFRIPTYDEPLAGEGQHGRSAPAAIANGDAASQGLASLFARLWDLRSGGGTVEVRLRDGETIVPDQFLKKVSRESGQAVFSVKDVDGRTSIVVVAWPSIARATLRGLSETPKELAD